MNSFAVSTAAAAAAAAVAVVVVAALATIVRYDLVSFGSLALDKKSTQHEYSL